MWRLWVSTFRTIQKYPVITTPPIAEKIVNINFLDRVIFRAWGFIPPVDRVDPNGQRPNGRRSRRRRTAHADRRHLKGDAEHAGAAGMDRRCGQTAACMVGWCFRLSSATVKKPGWRGQWLHLLSPSRDRLPKNPPTHTASAASILAVTSHSFTAARSPVCRGPGSRTARRARPGCGRLHGCSGCSGRFAGRDGCRGRRWDATRPAR